jgi:hypothetical protein
MFTKSADVKRGRDLKVAAVARRPKLGAPISLRIEEEIREHLQAFADEEDRSLSSYVARLLRQHVAAKLKEKKKKPKN